MRHFILASLVLCQCICAAQTSIHLQVDATDAARNIFHSKLVIPAAPGPVTLVFPKWIPGNHRSSGPIENVTGLRFEADGKSLAWERDPIDMYAFHVTLPAGSREVTAYLDTLTDTGSAGASGSSASTELLDLNWNQVVLYPQGANADSVEVAASLHLPSGWHFGTALSSTKGSGDTVEFSPVSLTTLVDSPVIAGAHYRRVQLTKAQEMPQHFIDLVGDTEAAIDMSPEDVTAYQKLVAETGALFGARHYREYHFLYTLSDQVGHHGLEHHQSSDNSTDERTLSDHDLHLLDAGLLPHEFTHSWNGKYRRPAGLATPNYQQPMIGDLLWVYEGLTTYLGNVLTARSGLWSPEQYREALALTAASLDHTAGRTWRPLDDTAVSVQILRMLGPEWDSWRRSLDYYPEGELIWLDVDTKIRELTHDRRSLDDFCRSFHGGQNTPPMVVPYTFDDLVRALNQVAPYDWAGFFKERVYSVQPHAPKDGITRGGWRLAYDDKPNLFDSTADKVSKNTDLMFSLGFWLKKDGEFGDVVPGLPAYQAGIGPGMKLVAVNGRAWSRDLLHDAIRDAQKTRHTIELIVENKEMFKTYSIPYFEGEKNPHLERVPSQTDFMGEILKPHAAP